MICIQPIPPSAFFTLSSTKNTLKHRSLALFPAIAPSHDTTIGVEQALRRLARSGEPHRVQLWLRRLEMVPLKHLKEAQTVPGSLGPKCRSYDNKDYVGFQHVFVFHGDVFGGRIAPNG